MEKKKEKLNKLLHILGKNKKIWKAKRTWRLEFYCNEAKIYAANY